MFLQSLVEQRSVPLAKISLVGSTVVVLFVHLTGMLVAMSPLMRYLHAEGTVQGYPAKALTQQILTDWRASTDCPLRYVVAPFFEGADCSHGAWLSCHL